MSLLLSLDTANETAIVCLAKDGQILASEINQDQKTHATFVHIAIERLTEKCGISLINIDAIAVVAGPGSYTGVRVGLSTAKGLCYALGKQLILLNSLAVMAKTMIMAPGNESEGCLYCPMIDARRMEVFTAVYDEHLNIIRSPAPLILDETSFQDLPEGSRLIISGSGAAKFKTLFQNKHAVFIELPVGPKAMAKLAQQAFATEDFADLAHSQPLYLKEFQSSPDGGQKLK